MRYQLGEILSVEAAPATADTWTVLDAASLPSSKVNPLPPYMSATTYPVSVETTDNGAGVGGIYLYSRCEANGTTTWSPWQYNAGGPGVTSPLDANLGCGDGADVLRLCGHEQNELIAGEAGKDSGHVQ